VVKGRDYMSQAAWLLRVNASSADARVLLWLDQAAAPKADIIAQVCLSWCDSPTRSMFLVLW